MYLKKTTKVLRIHTILGLQKRKAILVECCMGHQRQMQRKLAFYVWKNESQETQFFGQNFKRKEIDIFSKAKEKKCLGQVLFARSRTWWWFISQKCHSVCIIADAVTTDGDKKREKPWWLLFFFFFEEILCQEKKSCVFLRSNYDGAFWPPTSSMLRYIQSIKQSCPEKKNT